MRNFFLVFLVALFTVSPSVLFAAQKGKGAEEQISRTEQKKIKDEGTKAQKKEKKAKKEKSKKEKASQAKKDKASAAKKNKAGKMMAGNKVCPVSGDPISDDIKGNHTVEYKGKVYNLCCPGCKGKFLSDPEKYRAIADGEVAPQAEVVPSAE